MAKPRVSAGGGLPALLYVLRKGREAGGLWKLHKRLRSRNACKTCALGMGGQRGGMVNEAGSWPEVCKKSIQATVADMGSAISEDFLASTSIETLARLSPRACEELGRLAFPVLAEEGDTHFRRISWDDALDRAGAALREAPPPEAFFYVSGRSSNEAAFRAGNLAMYYPEANVLVPRRIDAASGTPAFKSVAVTLHPAD